MSREGRSSRNRVSILSWMWTIVLACIPGVNIIAEGGIWEAGQLEKVWSLGVYAVVIGSAITRPMDITKHFAKVIK